MKRLLLLLLFPTLALAQTVPNGGITQGQVWTVPQWTTAWQSKADTASPAFTGTPTVGSIPLVFYPQTAAESGAGVTPQSYGYPVGNVLRYMTTAQISDVTSGTHALDDATAIQNALTIGGSVQLPCYTYRVASGITVPEGSYLTSFDCATGAQTLSGATLQCDLSVATCLTVGGASATNRGVGISDLRVTRAAGTIPANSIGVLIQNVYHPLIHNITSISHSIGFKFLAGDSLGIAAMADRLYTGSITDAHLVIDTWPELRISQSEFGQGGPIDFNCNAYVRVQGGSTVNAASGPNTIFFDNTQFNQGTNTAAYWMSYVNKKPGSISDSGEYHFNNVHVEGLGTAYIQSDATWTTLNRIKVVNSHFNLNLPFLALNAATVPNNWQLSNNFFAGGLTLAPSSQFNFISLSNNQFLQAVSVTGVSNSTWLSTGNYYINGLTYAGSFNGLTSASDYLSGGSFTLTATAIGLASFNFDGSNFATGNWTPALAFNACNTGITYSRQVGTYHIVGNRVLADFSLILSSLGSCGNGAVTLTGLPYKVVNSTPASGGGGPLTYFTTGVSGLGGNLVANAAINTTTMNIFQGGATGIATITQTNLGATTALFGTISYEYQ